MVIKVDKKNKEPKLIEIKELLKKAKDDGKVTIGTFEFDDSINEIALDTIKNAPNINRIGKILVEVYSNEGKFIPHVHIHSFTGNRSVNGRIVYAFDSCICLHTPKYFPHGGEHQDTFTRQIQKDQFYNWMNSLSNFTIETDEKDEEGNPKIKILTFYEAAVKFWIGQNETADDIDLTTVPDYRKLNGDVSPNQRR